MVTPPARSRFRVSFPLRFGLAAAVVLAIVVMRPGLFEGASQLLSDASSAVAPEPVMPGGESETAVFALG